MSRTTLATDILGNQGVIPSSSNKDVAEVVRFYYNDYIEYVIILARKITRNKAIEIAKRWKEKRLIRPFLIFTNPDNREAFLVIVPYAGTATHEVRTLHIHDRFYHTDQKVISLLCFEEDPKKLRERYDKEFLPYEKVRDKFFEEYRSLYKKIVDETKKFESKVKGFSASSYAQRFLGRLMFLYFLQRKGWLKNDKRFIDSIRDYRELNTIFYEKLNREGSDLPYLNGSLFEKEEYMDGLEPKLTEIMDRIFNEAREVFNKYNFTVEESIIEKEVSLDPLLLGTVLENMLPEYERGQKGTFYTPVKEITFMCRRALAAYLGLNDMVKNYEDNNDSSNNSNNNSSSSSNSNNSNDGNNINSNSTAGNVSNISNSHYSNHASSKGKYTFVDALTCFIDRLKEMPRAEREREVRMIKEKLLDAKILDPAVGSGGFLVIMMQVMIQFIHELEATVNWHTDPEELKKRILPNLYGFDIEPEAVEIARLRLWLSLIIDQNYPEPLPNLDLNIQAIKDSLLRPFNLESFVSSYWGAESINRLLEELEDLHKKYVDEHNYGRKRELKSRIEEIYREIDDVIKGTDINLDIKDLLERYLPRQMDIILMNPPYVSQKDIPKVKKDRYIQMYGLDKTSDLYCYFMIRALDLVNASADGNSGVICTITSDKWLETDYGLTLQKMLKDHLIAIYGQKERTFEADVNTVITVYRKSNSITTTTTTSNSNSNHVNFVYLEDYASTKVINYYSIKRTELKEGKWYYLRAPRIWYYLREWLQQYRLKDIAEIRRGITTGANAFFYMKDVSHLFNTDLISNPTRFKDLPSDIRTKEDLERYGLAYIENEGGERFILERKNLKPLLKTPRELEHSYRIPELKTLCLYITSSMLNDVDDRYTKKYIEWGENREVKVKGKQQTVKGYHRLETFKNKDPWYKLPDLKPTRIILPKSWMDTAYIPFAEEPVICDQRLYTLYPRLSNKEYVNNNNNLYDPAFLTSSSSSLSSFSSSTNVAEYSEYKLWLYLNSTLFYLTMEMHCRRLGGGATDITIKDYEEMPVPPPDVIERIDFDHNRLLNRRALIYYEEVKQDDRKELDRAVLKALNIPDDQIPAVLDELYNAFIFVVEDRLIKADRPLKRTIEEEEEKKEKDEDKGKRRRGKGIGGRRENDDEGREEVEED